MNVQPTKSQQLFDVKVRVKVKVIYKAHLKTTHFHHSAVQLGHVIISTRSRISRMVSGVFSVPQRIQAFLRVKSGVLPCGRKVYLIKWPLSGLNTHQVVCVCVCVCVRENL